MGTITQQLVKGVTTDASPGLAFNAESYVLAWASNDQNGTISWLEFTFDANGQVKITKQAAPAGFRTQRGYGPALTVFKGTPWMAYLENQADAPVVPGSVKASPTLGGAPTETLQPPVIMVSSLAGGSWTQPAQPLWNPGLVNNDTYVPYYQGPAAMSAPAIAADETGMMAAWIEYAVNGSDSLALWSDGQVVSPAAQPQIFFATWTPAGGWTERAAIPNALSACTPALAAANGVFYLAFKGISNTSIYFSEYTRAKGWSKHAILPIGLTSTGPSLGLDNAGNLEILFLGELTTDLYWATLAAGTAWSPDDPGKGWSLTLQLPVIATAQQPTLTSQGSGPVVAITGATHPDVSVVPLSAFQPASPPSPLSGGSNYILAPYPPAQNDGKNCLTMQSVSVTVVATTDLVVDSNYIGADHAPPVGPLGFTIQLNCYSPANYAAAWQQYVVWVSETEIMGSINNWPLSGNYLCDTSLNLCKVPKANILPKGYQLNMQLVFVQGLVTGVIFNVIDNNGLLLMAARLDVPQSSPPAPITAFELNIVGPGNKQGATITGSGRIIYSTTPQLYAWDAHPVCAVFPGGTDEGSNIAYYPLSIYPGAKVTQNFDTSASTPVWPTVGGS